MTDLEFQLRASDLLETVKKIQRDQAAASNGLLEALKDMTSRMEELITALRADAAKWEDCWEAERADHERTIRHAEKAMNEDAR